MWNRAPVSCHGDKLLKHLMIENTKTKEQEKLLVNGLFYAIGHVPNTLIFGKQLHLDETGYIITKLRDGRQSTWTSIEGVFACGDVQDRIYRQAVTAAGSGCMSALDCERWLEEQH